MFNGDVASTNRELEYIQKAAQGDHEAFRHLVLIYETPVITYLQSILGDWENARDLAQETFIAAFYALPRWQPPELLKQRQSMPQHNWQSTRFSRDHPLAPWLYRIATNHALTFLKRQNKRAEVPFSTECNAEDSQIKESPQMPQSPGEMWENRYVAHELLHEALRQLSADDAYCIILRFIAGERYAEIAEQLDTTKEAVRKRVARGIVVLRSIYQALDREKE